MAHHRTLSRVDSFLNELFLEVSGVISTLTLYQEETAGEELRLYAETRADLREMYFREGSTTSEEGRSAFLSFNACVESVILYSGLLAHLLQCMEPS